MLDFFNFLTSQNGVNYQEFYGGGASYDWVKPRGAGMACFLLIGAGAGGRAGSTSAGGQGGGGGAITRWIGPAIFIPDVLTINIGRGGASASAGTNTTVVYKQSDATGYTLLTAEGAATGAGGSATSGGPFSAAGIYNSLSGPAGAAGSFVSALRFTTGGAGGASTTTGAGGNVIPPVYNYPTLNGSAAGPGAPVNGYFITEPVLLGVGGAGGGGNAAGAGGTGGRGGIGCGGGGGGRGSSGTSSGGRGGDGAAFVWAW